MALLASTNTASSRNRGDLGNSSQQVVNMRVVPKPKHVFKFCLAQGVCVWHKHILTHSCGFTEISGSGEGSSAVLSGRAVRLCRLSSQEVVGIQRRPLSPGSVRPDRATADPSAPLRSAIDGRLRAAATARSTLCRPTD